MTWEGRGTLGMARAWHAIALLLEFFETGQARSRPLTYLDYFEFTQACANQWVRVPLSAFQNLDNVGHGRKKWMLSSNSRVRGEANGDVRGHGRFQVW
jgi:hypothetical protein